MKRLYAIGEALIDMTPQETGKGISEVKGFEPHVGGAPANVLGAFRVLGGEASLITQVGDDPFGDKIVNLLEAYYIDTSYVLRTKEANTALAFVALKDDGDREFNFYRKPSADMLYDAKNVQDDWFSDAFALHFCSVDLGDFPMGEAHRRAIQVATEKDVLISFAKTAAANGYVKPEVNDGDVIDIKRGRHPAVEQLLGAGMFVSNDTYIDMSERSMLIITGPNMSGKSTYMRQTAVIVLMAQIGCFVPADYAEIGVVDRIFTRIGASDNLAYGQSTFYIEMSELAGILRNATSRSLIILDEIGRGTSTFDGLSIAWATASYLADPAHRVRTMFATHYHELTDLESEKEGIHNLSVAAAENGNDVVFLHNIIEGPASKSYGIHVARIAGIPETIRKQARQKLRELEDNSPVRREDGSSEQISFVSNELADEAISADAEKFRQIAAKLRETDINRITPVAALVALQDIMEEYIK